MNARSDTPADGLSGLVERVTFRSEETGFSVLKVKVKGRRDLVPVVGTVAAVAPGEWITAEGRWERNRDHGMQLRATSIRCQAPTSLEGIEKYLGSGLIKGIGPVYAKKLVDKFGEKVFDIIENSSARLQEVEGIGSGRRQQIKAAWAEQRVVREIMVFLHSHGISTSRALRVYKLYGEDAIARIRANPYLLARDIPGIGFKSADAVGDKLGFGHDSILRARGGLQHILSEATGEGHTALPTIVLLDETAKLLGVDEDVVRGALEREIADGQLVTEGIAGEPVVFLPALRAAENIIAETVLRLAAQPPAYPALDFDKALAWVQERTKKVLSASQQDALRCVLSSRLVVVTGGPGVGKTTLLDSLLKILAAKKVRFQLCAPTGRAAKRMGESTGQPAVTIHRLLEYLPSGGFKRGTGCPLETDLLVVDGVYLMDDEEGEPKGSPQALTNITRGLKRMAQKLDIPIVSTTQALSWKLNNKKTRAITADAIGYSSSFVQDADLVLGVERNPDLDDQAIIRVVAARTAPTGEVHIKWDWENMDFSEVTADGYGVGDAFD